MLLSDDLRRSIDAYLRGESTLDDIQRWLARHVQAIADCESADPVVRDLAEEVWTLLIEYQDRERDEASVRQALRQLLVPITSPAD